MMGQNLNINTLSTKIFNKKNLDKKLNICMITNNYTPYSGGVVSSINSYRQELINRGHRVKIITLDFLDKYQNTEEPNDIIRLKCLLKITYNNNPIAYPLNPDKQIIQIIKSLKPDIIHSHHPFLLGPSALRASKLLNIPFVFTYHTIYEKFLYHIPLPNIIIKPITKILVRSFCYKAPNIIIPSNSVLDYIKDNNIVHNKSNVVIIPSGILNIFKKRKFQYKETNSKKKFKLLTVSRFTKEKNINFLIKAFSKLDQKLFKLTLVGYGPELNNLKDYAYNKLNLSMNNINFIIRPNKEELVNIYDKSDLFLFSSKNETQAIVLAESMARGTPIITLTGSGVIDIIKNNYNGFIINNIEEMIQKINLVKSDINIFKRLQYNSWITSKNYWPEICTNRLENLYINLILNKN